jgi:hypothetical protein
MPHLWIDKHWLCWHLQVGPHYFRLRFNRQGWRRVCIDGTYCARESECNIWGCMKEPG